MPDKQGDGISYSSGTWVPQIGYGYALQAKLQIGSDGIKACDRALADPLLLPEHRVRRANLLTMRGLYNVMAGNRAEAKVAFQQADTLAPSGDRFFSRSLGASGALFRAIAAYFEKDAGSVKRLAAQASATRPYYPELGLIAAQIEVAATGDEKTYDARLATLARYDPDLLRDMFFHRFNRRDFVGALTIVDGIRFAPPPERGGFNLPLASGALYRQEIARSEVAGMAAYAHAALGQEGQAQARLASAAAAMALLAGPPGGEKAGGRPSASLLEARSAIPEAERRLKTWGQLVRLRSMLASGKVDAVEVEFQDIPLGPNGALIDMLESLGRAKPSLRSTVDPLAARLQAVLDKSWAEVFEHMGNMLDQLPVPENGERLPAYDGGSDSTWTLDTNGYRQYASANPGWTYVAFTTMGSTRAIVAEMALLRACDLARRAGKRGMMIRSRFVQKRSYVNRWTAEESPAGFYAQYEVMFVDPNNLAAELERDRWRIVDVERVYADLASLYIAN